MNKILPAILLLMVSLGAYAEEAPAPAELPPINMPAIITFAVLFFGGIAWFFWMVWRKDRASRNEEQQ